MSWKWDINDRHSETTLLPSYREVRLLFWPRRVLSPLLRPWRDLLPVPSLSILAVFSPHYPKAAIDRKGLLESKALAEKRWRGISLLTQARESWRCFGIGAWILLSKGRDCSCDSVTHTHQTHPVCCPNCEKEKSKLRSFLPENRQLA